MNKVVLRCTIDDSKQCVEFWDNGETDEDTTVRDKFHKRYSRPTIQLNDHGDVVQVSFNNQVRSCQLDHGKNIPVVSRIGLIL